MRDLLAVWRNTRLVVQVAVTAALYASVLIPFKAVAIIIPGITEVRPANAIPVVLSLLFGPAAAWGSAFGNLIGDALGGTLGLGSLFGFVGNFLYAYVPYRAWGVHRMAAREPDAPPLARAGIGEFVLVAGLASIVCAAVVSWGVELLGLAPFKVVSVAVTLNNFLVTLVLGPPLLAALYPRVWRWGLLYWQVLDRETMHRSAVTTIGALVCWAGALAVLVTGLGVATQGAAGTGIVRATAPPLAIMLIGTLLL